MMLTHRMVRYMGTFLDNFPACCTCYSVVKLPSRLFVLPKMVSFLEVSVFVIWRTWLSEASSEMISLVVNSKGFSIQHKRSISVHCLEFRKIPSAALSLPCMGSFFLFLLLLWQKHASRPIESLVFQYVSALRMIN